MKEIEEKYKLTRKRGSLIGAFFDVFRLRGPSWVIYYSFLNIMSILLAPLRDYYYLRKYKTNNLSKNIFSFNKKKFKYLSHPYNTTWKHERAIEIPLAKHYLDKFKASETLEVGNVLQNYFPTKHIVVDNYEIAPRVINKDIVDYYPKRNFKLIISVSTLEHVGVDGIKEEGKAIRAIEHLANLLAPGGMLVFTIPLGYNKLLDQAILSGKLKLNKASYFRKVSPHNQWIQVGKSERKNALYGFPFRWGNVIVLAEIKK